MERQKKKKSDKIIDGLVLFSSIIMILLLIVVLLGALAYWTQLFEQIDANSTSLKLFFVANLITFVSVIAQWLEGRINEVIRLVPKFRNKEVKR